MIDRSIVPITHGSKIRSCELDGFVVTEDSHLPNTHLSRHSHTLANISCVLDGSFTESFGKSNFDCAARSLVVKPPTEPHANHYGVDGARCLLIEVKESQLTCLQQVTNLFREPSHSREIPLAAFPVRLSRELRIMDCVSPLSIEGLIFELLAELTREKLKAASNTEPRWIRDAIAVLHDSFLTPLTLRSIAAEIGIHPSHLAKLFRRFRQCTVGEYVRQLRLSYAIERLSKSNQSIAEIALTSGFYDQAHLTNAFKAAMGTTPARFRAQLERKTS